MSFTVALLSACYQLVNGTQLDLRIAAWVDYCRWYADGLQRFLSSHASRIEACICKRRLIHPYVKEARFPLPLHRLILFSHAHWGYQVLNEETSCKRHVTLFRVKLPHFVRNNSCCGYQVEKERHLSCSVVSCRCTYSSCVYNRDEPCGKESYTGLLF